MGCHRGILVEQHIQQMFRRDAGMPALFCKVTRTVQGALELCRQFIQWKCHVVRSPLSLYSRRRLRGGGTGFSICLVSGVEGCSSRELHEVRELIGCACRGGRKGRGVASPRTTAAASAPSYG